MSSRMRWGGAALLALVAAVVVVRTQPQGISFFSLDPDYAQHLYGVASSFQKGPNVPTHGYLGGVVVLQNGDVIAAECDTNGTRLHRFSAATLRRPGHGRDAPPGDDHPDRWWLRHHARPRRLHLLEHERRQERRREDQSGEWRVHQDGTSRQCARHRNRFGERSPGLRGPGLQAGFVKPAPPTCKILDLDPATNTTTTVISFPVAQVGYVDGITLDPTGTSPVPDEPLSHLQSGGHHPLAPGRVRAWGPGPRPLVRHAGAVDPRDV